MCSCAEQITNPCADGRVSIALTEDYRFEPYLVCKDGSWIAASIIIAGVEEAHLRYILGIGLARQKIWRRPAGQNGLRTMSAGWVLHFDCNPDLILARPMKEQNEYLASRDQLGLPPLRWAADLRFLAMQQE
jgi:hypothetical protein